MKERINYNEYLILKKENNKYLVFLGSSKHNENDRYGLSFDTLRQAEMAIDVVLEKEKRIIEERINALYKGKDLVPSIPKY